jgi:hypothetical protein
MQVLFSLPEMKAAYFTPADDVFESCSGDPTSDLPLQVLALTNCLLVLSVVSRCCIYPLIIFLPL